MNLNNERPPITARHISQLGLGRTYTDRKGIKFPRNEEASIDRSWWDFEAMYVSDLFFFIR